jgi:hypothetical protein
MTLSAFKPCTLQTVAESVKFESVHIKESSTVLDYIVSFFVKNQRYITRMT